MTPRPEVAVGAVVVHDGRLLLVRRGRPPGETRWSIPGGRVEAGETLAAAVERELAEETGLTGRCGDLVGWVELLGEDHHFVVLDFRVEVPAPGPLVPGDDADAAAWVPVADVAERDDLVDGLARFLLDHGVIPG